MEDDKNITVMSKHEEFFSDLVHKALKGEHNKFEFIRSFQGYLAAKDYKKGCKTIIKSFNKICVGMYETYIDQIAKGTQDFDLITALKQFEKCRDFYKSEAGIAKDMISEYKAYVFSGHLIDTFMGIPRKEEDLVDYRKLPWRLF